MTLPSSRKPWTGQGQTHFLEPFLEREFDIRLNRKALDIGLCHANLAPAPSNGAALVSTIVLVILPFGHRCSTSIATFHGRSSLAPPYRRRLDLLTAACAAAARAGPIVQTVWRCITAIIDADQSHKCSVRELT